MLQHALQSLQALIDAGAPFHGLFPSVLDRRTGRMPHSLPAAISGQRDNDRSFPGSNLMHDHAVLHALYAVGRAMNRADFAAAADAYLHRFATHCTDTPTGLFPWGEHSFWDLVDDRPGNSFNLKRQATPLTHDHLLQAPPWLWQKLFAINPACVRHFAAGLAGHWRDDGVEYQRHALINTPGPGAKDPRSCDFPRHSGFYIVDLAVIHRLQAEPAHREAIVRFADYWWSRRDAQDVCAIESRTPAEQTAFAGINCPGQTMSLGLSLCESAEFVDLPELSVRGQSYLRAFLDVPHDLANGRIIHSYHRDTREPTSIAAIWGSRYGAHPAASHGLLCLRAMRYLNDPRLLAIAEAIAHQYALQPLPADVACPAKDAGLALGLLAELFVVTGERAWLDRGLALAGQIAPAYFDQPLPRVASGADWYESQTLPGHLIYGLARLALLADGVNPSVLPGDFTCR